MNNFVRCFAMLLVAASSCVVYSQTTSFMFQGKLTEAGAPADGVYQMQFKLFDSLSGGNQMGTTVSNSSVTVTQGIFSTQLDFGVNAFPGADRFLQIEVRKTSNDTYTPLSPRQQISSSPYAIKALFAGQADTALDSQKLGGVSAAQYVTTATGGTNFIRNDTAPQTGNFNINGAGTLSTLNLTGATAPSVAPAGQARLFFNSTTNKLRISENGGSFVDLVGATGVSGSGTQNNLPMWTNANTLGDSAIIQSGTNIGIGSTPFWPFHLKKPENTGAGLQARVTNTSTSGNSFATYSLEANNGGVVAQMAADGLGTGLLGTPGGFLGTYTNHPFALTTANIERMRITSAGNVGIGTSNPASKFHVEGDMVLNSAGPTLYTGTGPSELNRYLNLINSPTSPSASGLKAGGVLISDSYAYANPGKNDLIVKGNVGIGTANPQNTLDLNGFFRAVNVAGGNVTSETTGGVNSWAKFWIKTPAQTWSIGSSNNFNGNQLYFSDQTGGGPIRMAIMPAGQVGIGTTNPGARLHVLTTTGEQGLFVDGNVGQEAGKFGLPKAMLEVARINGAILRCYNAVTNQTSGGCGMSVGVSGGVFFNIHFPFRVTDRFFSLTTQRETDSGAQIGMRGFDQNDISGQTAIVFYYSAQTNAGQSFFLIVY